MMDADLLLGVREAVIQGFLHLVIKVGDDDIG
jgi:hypothetical protein